MQRASGPDVPCGPAPGNGQGRPRLAGLRVAEAVPDPADRRFEEARAREREAWLTLLSVEGLGPMTFARLLAVFGSAVNVLAVAAGPSGAERLVEATAPASGQAGAAAPQEASPEAASDDPAESPRLSRELAARVHEAAGGSRRCIERLRALGLSIVTLDDEEYPARLRRVDMPPPLLFVRGSMAALNGASAVAVVGTRWPSDKGRMIAGWIGSALGRAGATVVSGLAVGIDGAAHAAVVSEGGATVAVLGSGHARLFPKAHERLSDAIIQAGGAVISELAPDTPATRGTFPRRNRLVSGLSDATIVVEAGRRSGALITAAWALEQGRECFLVPGPLDSPTSEGCHMFLRSFPGQTRVVCGIPELLEDLGLGGEADGQAVGAESGGPPGAESRSRRPSARAPRAGGRAVLASLDSVERQVAGILVRKPATADELAVACGLAPAAVLSVLTLLELRGLVVGAYGRYRAAGALAQWPGR